MIANTALAIVLAAAVIVTIVWAAAGGFLRGCELVTASAPAWLWAVYSEFRPFYLPAVATQAVVFVLTTGNIEAALVAALNLIPWALFRDVKQVAR